MDRVQELISFATNRRKRERSRPMSESSLQALIPIAVVIVGGCEPCAESMVKRALQQGSAPQDIDMVMRIVADMNKQECFLKAVGPDVIQRMDKPLAAGLRTLQQAIATAAE